jgi:antitoxin ParD1/3/4
LTRIAVGVTLAAKDLVMQTINIVLPDPMKQYLEEQVVAGEYSSVSEYMHELVRADQKRNAKVQLEQTLLESLHEGEPLEATPKFWANLREELKNRPKARQTVRER